MKVFETFRIGGKKFLAIPRNDQEAVYIIDDNGNGYGGWYSAASFRKAYIGKDPRLPAREVRIPMGRVRLTTQPE